MTINELIYVKCLIHDKHSKNGVVIIIMSIIIIDILLLTFMETQIIDIHGENICQEPFGNLQI